MDKSQGINLTTLAANLRAAQGVKGGGAVAGYALTLYSDGSAKLDESVDGGMSVPAGFIPADMPWAEVCKLLLAVAAGYARK